SARKAAGVKIRQPLQALLVRAPGPAATEGLRRFEAELRDELNVKTVSYLDNNTSLVEYRFKPNLRSVGKKFGKLVPALGATLRELGGEEARSSVKTLESGGTYSLQVSEQTLELGADDVLIETT